MPVAVTLWFLQAGPSTSSALLHTPGQSMPTSRRRIPTRLHRLPHCQAVSAWISAVIAWAAAVSLARPAGPLLRSRKATSAPQDRCRQQLEPVQLGEQVGAGVFATASGGDQRTSLETVELLLEVVRVDEPAVPENAGGLEGAAAVHHPAGEFPLGTVEVAVHHARRCGPTSIEWFRWPRGGEGSR
ncbi:hypothetical protein ACFV10_27265 [Streptomyces cyaneofuscatus]|uniref:hypothetical protein n=1 Tax=Streptomyces cyaneofuscatus TaxID=66883 RepID=UPI003698E042